MSSVLIFLHQRSVMKLKYVSTLIRHKLSKQRLCPKKSRRYREMRLHLSQQICWVD